MVKEYANEILASYVAACEANGFAVSDQVFVAKNLVTEKPFLALCDQIGGFVASVAASVRKSLGNRYSKVTDKQRNALASALVQKYGAAQAIINAAY
jgi:hypothetical protein